MRNMSSCTCSECGAGFFHNTFFQTQQCPICGGELDYEGNTEYGFDTEKIIPFSIGKEDAICRMRDYLKKKKMLPDEFKAEKHLEDIVGIYVPFYLFDTAAKEVRESEIREEGETSEYYSEKITYYTHYKLHLETSCDLKMIPVCASSIFPVEQMESIEPFETSLLTEVSQSVVGEYWLNTIDTEISEVLPKIDGRSKQEIDSQTSLYIRHKYNDNDYYISSDYEVNPTNLIIAWVPTWILSTKYNGQNYVLALNGQNGKIAGTLPEDNTKKWASSIILFLGIEVVWNLIIRKSAHVSFGMWIFHYVIIPTIGSWIGTKIMKNRLNDVEEAYGAKNYISASGMRVDYENIEYDRTTHETERIYHPEDYDDRYK